MPTDGHRCSQLLVLFLQYLELLLMVLLAGGICSKLGCRRLRVAAACTDTGALTEVLLLMLGQLLLGLMMLATVVVQLVVVTLVLEARLSSLWVDALETSATTSAIDLCRRV